MRQASDGMGSQGLNGCHPEWTNQNHALCTRFYTCKRILLVPVVLIRLRCQSVLVMVRGCFEDSVIILSVEIDIVFA